MSFGVLVAFALELSTASGPIDEALDAADVPQRLRAAFTVRLETGRAVRELRYDPRQVDGERWEVLDTEGADDELDAISAAWQADAVPDRRLFLPSLRQSVGETVTVDDFGKAWRLRFSHAPSFDTRMPGARFEGSLDAELWLRPGAKRFTRLDYRLAEPVMTSRGISLEGFRQSYLLETDPLWGVSYISSYAVSYKAEGLYRTEDLDYTVQVTSAEFFFTSPEARARFQARRQSATGPSVASR